MSVFADSSALVKLYANEDGHESVRRLRNVIVSVLARVEVPAALWRKHRMGELPEQHARLLTDVFEADYFGTRNSPPKFTAVGCPPSVLDGAASLCAVHGLCAYDAIQLATGLAVRIADPQCQSFSAFDAALRRAAAAEGFAVVPKL